MDSKEFGERLRQELDKKGIRYTYAAEKMGWSRQLLNAKMLGQNQWKLDEVSKAIQAFDLPKDIML